MRLANDSAEQNTRLILLTADHRINERINLTRTDVTQDMGQLKVYKEQTLCSNTLASMSRHISDRY